jgi:hypothetical protein
MHGIIPAEGVRLLLAEALVALTTAELPTAVLVLLRLILPAHGHHVLGVARVIHLLATVSAPGLQLLLMLLLVDFLLVLQRLSLRRVLHAMEGIGLVAQALLGLAVVVVAAG